MNALVIFAHPTKESLNGAFLQKTLEGLRHNPAITEIELLDLYEENFDPLLRFNKEKKRRDMHKDPAFAANREQIRRADLFVFIYPIWWGRPPAMLMGYIDQLFSSNFAYREGKIMPQGLLRGKRVVCISTMKAPAVYPALILGNAYRILMKRALFNFVGIRKVRFFEFGSMEKKGGRQAAQLEKIHTYMSRIDAGRKKRQPAAAGKTVRARENPALS